MSRPSAEGRVHRARAAQGKWATMAVKERIRVLRELRCAIAVGRDAIVDAIVADTGKEPLDALSGDVLVTLEQMLFYERKAAKLLAKRRLATDHVLFSRCSFYEEFGPHGVALIYGASNYPFQLAMVPAITALYAGNAVVLKVSERAPSVARLIERLAEGLPPDLLQTVDDMPERAGEYIDAGPDIVFFTGSSRNGREVAVRAAAKLIPSVLELGGKDAAIVFADCDFTRTINGIVYGVFLNAGQVCVGIKRLYIERTICQKFLGELRERVHDLRAGPEPISRPVRVQNAKLREGVRAQVDEAVALGATLEVGGGECERPTVLSGVPAAARLLTEESFGPVLCVAPFDTEAEALALANSSSFALGASVWTEDRGRGRRIAAQLHAGNCAINDVIRNIANPAAGFGGNGASGYGRYHGPHGLLAFSRVKTVMAVRRGKARERHWFPFTEETRRGLNVLIELRQRPLGWLGSIGRVVTKLSILFLLTGLTVRAQDPKGHLLLEVRVPAKDRGQLAWAVFTSADGFPNDTEKAVRHGFAHSSGPQDDIRVDVGSLPVGQYAVAVYLDENGNGKLDYRRFGIPKEPVGASRNPAPRKGPPRFRDCAFQLGDEKKTVEIRLVDPL